MRVLYVTPAFPPFPGGGERYVRDLARSLSGREHQITILTSLARRERDFWQGVRSQHRQEQEKSLTVVRCPIRAVPTGRIGLMTLRKAMVLLSSLPGDQSRQLSRMARFFPPIQALDQALESLCERFDLVHGFNISWEYPLLCGWRFARSRNIPFIITPFAHLGSSHRDRVALNSTMDHQCQVMSDADALLALTPVETEGLRRWNVRFRHGDVVGGGVSPPPPGLDPTAVLQKYQLRTPLVLFIGRANRDKGALDAIQAVRRLRQGGHNLTLALVGQSTPDLEQALARLNEADRTTIRPLGVLAETEKHALLEASSMLLLPSQSESFGIVLLEAWTHRKPVIGARSGGIPAVVDANENGLLIEYGDVSELGRGIERLLSDPGLAQRLGEQGWRKVQSTYLWEKVADRVLMNYRHVLDQ